MRRALRLLGRLSVALLGACGPNQPEVQRPPPREGVTPVRALVHAPPPLPPCPPLPASPAALARVPLPGLPAPIDVERATRLESFYERLASLARGEATDHVRIAVFGDSNLTMDFTSGRMRRNLQLRFGDGGHGFVAAGKPWSHYRHMDVEHGVVSGWKPYAITTSPTGDGFYGLGGIVVEPQWQGATTFVATAGPNAPVGQAASRFDVFYLQRRKGGTFRVRLDGREVERVSTASEVHGLGVHPVRAEEGPHRLDLVAASAELVRLFGVALERDKPGVVVDSFGVGSLNTKTFMRTDMPLYEAMLRARRYDLVILLLGANDCFTMDAVPAGLLKLERALAEALPNAGLVVVTPPDRGLFRSFPPTLKVVRQRRTLAEQNGWALWDQFAAMGGEGSMKGFVASELAYRDAIHFTERGGAAVGDLFVEALLRGYETHMSDASASRCVTAAQKEVVLVP